MAVITVNVPAERATEYLELVREQLAAGYTSGLEFPGTNWTVTFDDGEDATDLT